MSELCLYLMGTMHPGSSCDGGISATPQMKLQLSQQAWARGRGWALHFRASQAERSSRDRFRCQWVLQVTSFSPFPSQVCYWAVSDGLVQPGLPGHRGHRDIPADGAQDVHGQLPSGHGCPADQLWCKCGGCFGGVHRTAGRLASEPETMGLTRSCKTHVAFRERGAASMSGR